MNCFILLLCDRALVSTSNGVYWFFSFNTLRSVEFYPVIKLSILPKLPDSWIIINGSEWPEWPEPIAGCWFLFWLWLAIIIAMSSFYIFRYFLRSSSFIFFIKLLFYSISLWFWTKRCLQICYISFCFVFIYWICFDRLLFAWLSCAYKVIRSYL